MKHVAPATHMVSDCPERLCEVFTGPEEWLPVSIEALTPTQRAFWATVSNAKQLWRRHSVSSRRSYWRHFNVVAEAASSQFDAMREAARAGFDLDGAMACLALTGRGFHGQRGRAWATQAGNLHLTALVPVNAAVTAVLPALTMLPAVAVLDAIHQTLGARVRPAIKWVNDVLIGERKVAGVLAATLSKNRTVERACFGIGINVASRPPIEPTPFVPYTGCLRDVEGDAHGDLLWRICFSLLDALERAMGTLLSEGPGPLLRRYLNASLVIGRRVAVFAESTDGHTRAALGRSVAEGVVEAVNHDLTLSLRCHPEPVCTGRLVLDPQDALQAACSRPTPALRRT